MAIPVVTFESNHEVEHATAAAGPPTAHQLPVAGPAAGADQRTPAQQRHPEVIRAILLRGSPRLRRGLPGMPGRRVVHGDRPAAAPADGHPQDKLRRGLAAAAPRAEVSRAVQHPHY